ncbi:hypothetical protein BCR44DRAFT_1432066 [Catenaria anguillulae PL171]|uniref:P-loop containing nucleoside triphosphate hydrolase protein n=1 Tax=Catenaria anguillulae PL171 TaxID=765915 RepID=A0A1Y2HPJ4_9FUNG|nr:hypothetical protein BCR44DRAFT_1432066 [Catenaria anguillulae PL171]
MPSPSQSASPAAAALALAPASSTGSGSGTGAGDGSPYEALALGRFTPRQDFQPLYQDQDHDGPPSSSSSSAIAPSPAQDDAAFALAPSPLDTQPWYSYNRLMFSWVNPLIALGDAIDPSNMHAVPRTATAQATATAFDSAWATELATLGPQKARIMWTLVRVHSTELAIAGLVGFLEIGIKLAEAVTLGLVVQHFQTNQAAELASPATPIPYSPLGMGILWVLLLAGATGIHALFRHNYGFLTQFTAAKMRTSLMAAVFAKSLRMPSHSISPGVVVNLLSNDTAILDALNVHGHQLYLAPFETLVCAYWLYRELGWPGLVGLAVIALMVVQQQWFGRMYQQARSKTVKWRDARVRLMTDLVQGIAVVKFNSWQQPFTAQVTDLRTHELHGLSRAATLDAILEASFFSFMMVISLVTYGTCFLANIPLLPSQLFVSLSLFAILRLTLATFLPKGFKAVSEGRVSLGRIAAFLAQDERDVVESGSGSKVLDQPLVLENARFTWPTTSSSTMASTAIPTPSTDFVLDSSLLSALLGEMPSLTHAKAPHMLAGLSIGYAPQTPWLMSGTVQENILFGLPLDGPWLDRVIDMCDLGPDLQMWPNGLDTRVGERGVQLSGGQRARIGLARAVYARPQVLVTDDVFAALDAKVARKVFDKVVQGGWSGATKVIVTHSLALARQCDQVLQGTWDEVVARAAKPGRGGWLPTVAEWEDKHRVQQQQQQQGADKYVSIRSVAGTASFMSSLAAARSDAASVRSLAPSTRTGTIATAVTTGTAASPTTAATPETAKFLSHSPTSQAQDEQSAIGSVPWSTYIRFFISPTPLATLVMCLFLMILGQALAIGADWFLAQWVRGPTQLQSSDTFHMSWFAGLVVAAVAVGMLRAVVAFSMLLNASRVASVEMLQRVLDAPLAWFVDRPTGQILNRFAKDQSQVDETLPSLFFNLVQLMFLILGSIAVVLMVLPWVALSLPVLVFIFWRIRSSYIATNRRLKRLESTTRSPIYAHLSESLDALPVLRAMNAREAFTRKFLALIDGNSRAVLDLQGVTRWIAVRLDLLLAGFILIAGLVAVAVAEFSELAPSLVGLALTYALQMNRVLQFATRQSVEAEVLMVCVERMHQYCDLPGEAVPPSKYTKQVDGIEMPTAFAAAATSDLAAVGSTNKQPPKGWPQTSNVLVQDMSMRYKPTLPPVLKGWNLEFKSGERIGIVGRTGAGKSSFVQALFKMYPIQGEIYLDGVASSSLDIIEYRKQLAIIPQSPFLFHGTVRSNLDPWNTYSDHALWDSLDRVGLKPMVTALDGQLDAPVDDGGSNWSVGSRQLLCLARALLRNARILICDEAAANVDHASDELIQHTLHTQVPHDTLVITIAHRLASIMTYDKVLVVDKGQVVEFGHPYQLLMLGGATLARGGGAVGVFKSMVEEMGPEVSAQLWVVARKSWERHEAKVRDAEEWVTTPRR